MLLLIDGYNLLHQSDLLPRGRGQHWLRRARQRLLRRLATALDAPLRSETCIVFDAQDPPPGRPSQLSYQGIDVRFAVEAPEADDVLERLIAQHPTPRRLFVVSSDHRIQRAARRRRCGFDDADRWYEHLLDGRPRLAIPWPPPDAEPLGEAAASVDPALVGDTAGWLEAFGFPVPEQEDAAEKKASEEPQVEAPKPPRGKAAKKPAKGSKTAAPVKKAPVKKAPVKKAPVKKPPAKMPPGSQRPAKLKKPPRPASESPRDPNRPLDGSPHNPFPEGYGEDLLGP